MHLLPRVRSRDGSRLPELRRRVGAAAAPAQARMNYRHAYHAGNFADVHKHIALVAVLLHLRKKEKPFAVIDTHAGAGLYELSGTEALKTTEAEEGIGRLRSMAAQTRALRHYLEMV